MHHRFGAWGPRIAATVCLALFQSCDASDTPNVEALTHSVDAVDQPIPPDGLLDGIPASDRDAELVRFADGIPLDELPADERTLVEAANERDALRAPARSALRALAESQASRISRSDAGATTEQDAGAVHEIAQ